MAPVATGYVIGDGRMHSRSIDVAGDTAMVLMVHNAHQAGQSTNLTPQQKPCSDGTRRGR